VYTARWRCFASTMSGAARRRSPGSRRILVEELPAVRAGW
jgi:hypothetical protein